MGPTPFYGARAEKKTPFAIKQTNICRLSGDINQSINIIKFMVYIHHHIAQVLHIVSTS